LVAAAETNFAWVLLVSVVDVDVIILVFIFALEVIFILIFIFVFVSFGTFGGSGPVIFLSLVPFLDVFEDIVGGLAAAKGEILFVVVGSFVVGTLFPLVVVILVAAR